MPEGGRRGIVFHLRALADRKPGAAMIELFEVTIMICTAWIAVSAILRWRRR
jgi:hypothetical protein